MNYEEAISYLEKSHKIGSKKGYFNYSKLLNNLKNPQKNLKVIHIAGTNGKGSISTMTASVLKENGYKVGLFTSPHLLRYNERIKINFDNISDYDFCYYVSKIALEVENLFPNREEYFSFFEIVTAVAFCYFSDKKVDFTILEVGLGGRLDATNIIEKSLVSVITSIGFDHMNYLGNTISEIAREKAGIIKAGCPVVVYPMQDEVYSIVSDIAKTKNSEIYYDEPTIDIEDKTIIIKNKYYNYNSIELGIKGNYQIYNASVVLLVVHILNKIGLNISKKAIYFGLKKAYICGRMEVVSIKPFVILDGAHNINGIVQLCNEIDIIKSKNNKKIIVLVAILNDKNYSKMIEKLSKHCDNLIFTQCLNSRTLTIEEVEKNINIKNISYEKNCHKAYEDVIKKFDDSIIICCGSFYFISDILFYLRRN